MKQNSCNCRYDWSNPPEYLVEWARAVGYKQCDKIQRERLIGRVCLAAMAFILLLALLIAGCNQHPVWADEPVILTASWYSVESLKREGTWKYSKGVMANGQKFNDEGFTCATRLFRLGTILKVSNESNGKYVFVKVTDRIGKRFATTRIDLSPKAFAVLVNLKQGIVSVIVEVIQ